MKSKKASAWIWLILVLIIIVVIGVYFLFFKKTSIASEGLNCNILLKNGSTYQIVLGKFSQPYAPNYQKHLDEIDYTKMTSMIDAYHSYGGYGWDGYLLLVDDNTRDRALSGDAKGNGAISKMLNENIGKFSEPLISVVYTHWLEFKRDEKIHRLIVGKTSESITAVAELVRQGNEWRITTSFSMGLLPFSIDNYEILAQSCV